ncbi:hypothetical protein [Leptolyngbya sp. BC1307]|nr:hypothetical protein [Leptolyngbya sp. BC1307]
MLSAIVDIINRPKAFTGLNHNSKALPFLQQQGFFVDELRINY